MQIFSNDAVTRRRLGLGLVALAAAGCMPKEAGPAPDPDLSVGEGRAQLGVAARRLKILCLHGYHGSARALRSQMGSLVAELEPLAELVFVDAPSLAAGDYGWWHAVEDESARERDDPGVSGPRRHYRGWERTRDAIVASFTAEGSFDGVLGFSQGAALTGLLVGLRAPAGTEAADRPLRFDFAIMIGGFPSNDPDLAKLYARRDSYALSSLHVLGRADGVVPSDDSLALAARFASPVLVEHAGGHVIPAERPARDAIRAFLEERLRARGVLGRTR